MLHAGGSGRLERASAQLDVAWQKAGTDNWAEA
jgi:hypothetical protein